MDDMDVDFVVAVEESIEKEESDQKFDIARQIAALLNQLKPAHRFWVWCIVNELLIQTE